MLKLTTALFVLAGAISNVNAAHQKLQHEVGAKRDMALSSSTSSLLGATPSKKSAGKKSVLFKTGLALKQLDLKADAAGQTPCLSVNVPGFKINVSNLNTCSEFVRWSLENWLNSECRYYQPQEPLKPFNKTVALPNRSQISR